MAREISGIKKPGRGRPKTNSTGIMVRMPPDQLARLDKWLKAQPDMPSRPEAVRRLLDEGLG